MSPNAAILGDPRVRQSISCKGKGALLLVSQDESRRSLNYVTITSHTYFEQYCVSGLIFNRNKEQLELPSTAWQNLRLKLDLRKKSFIWILNILEGIRGDSTINIHVATANACTSFPVCARGTTLSFRIKARFVLPRNGSRDIDLLLSGMHSK